MKSLIKLLADCQTKKADKSSNGYYIVTEKWNTCFHRWATKMTGKIEVRVNSSPTCMHSYTRIPVSLKNNIYFVYANRKKNKGVIITLQEGDLIVGGYEPQQSGDFLNYAYLVYSKNGEAPIVEKYPQEGVWIIFAHEEKEALKFNPDMLCPAHYHVRSFGI